MNNILRKQKARRFAGDTRIKRVEAYKIPVIQPLYKNVPISSEDDDNKVKSEIEKPKRIKKDKNENQLKFFINL